jgi:resuscitation-promoting factor RpfB
MTDINNIQLQADSNEESVSRSSLPILYPLIFLFICLIGGIIFWINSSKTITSPVNSKIVIISHDGQKIYVPTKISTVGGVLSSLNIKINPGDVVAPSPTTQINQDDFRINVFRARPIELVNGTSRTFSYSAATTPRAIATQVGIKVYPEDYLNVIPSTNFLTDSAIGERIVIDPATPVNLNIYGTPTVVRTHAKTIDEFEQQEHIKLGKGDSITPFGATPITANMAVFLIHKGTNITNVTQPIPMPIQTIEDSSLAYGTSAITQKGSPGTETITYLNQLQNGKIVSQTVLQTIVTVQPVTEIIDQGTSLSGIKGDMALAGISPSDYQYADYIISHESGWCPTKAQGEHYCPAIPDNSGTSNGYGLCQATPGYKMSSAGSDWATNPITQLRWCTGYANSRYGGWYNAYIHWINNGNW